MSIYTFNEENGMDSKTQHIIIIIFKKWYNLIFVRSFKKKEIYLYVVEKKNFTFIATWGILIIWK